MCCCLTVSLNLFTNLVQRIADDIMELIYCQRQRHCPPSTSGSLRSVVVPTIEDHQQCHRRRRCRSPQQSSNGDHHPQPQLLDQQQQQRDEDAKGTDLLAEVMMEAPQPPPAAVGSSFYNVIYDTVELEPYYRVVDRLQSEEILRGGPDGSCLVRPFRMEHPHIRYILSVYAAGIYFHLFIRLTAPNGMYALGLVKPKERQFKFPSDIVQYYRTHRLQCTSSSSSSNTASVAQIRLRLLPIVNGDDDGRPRRRSCDNATESNAME